MLDLPKSPPPRKISPKRPAIAPPVFVIEDDPHWQDFYRTILGSTYELKIFPDGVAAIQAIDDARPAAIILDMLLAGPSAPSFLAELQSYPDLATIPVALVTGVEIQADLSPYGVTQIFDKATFEPKDLLSWISKQTP